MGLGSGSLGYSGRRWGRWLFRINPLGIGRRR